MAYRYHRAVPVNDKADGFNEFDTISVDLTFENRSLLLNTVRFEGDLRVQQSSANLNGQDIRLDGETGAHGLCERIDISSKKGVLENFQNYPRYVKMVQDATKNRDDVFNSSEICELKTARDNYYNSILQGETNKVVGTNVNKDNSFSFKPLICLNSAYSASGLPRVSYNKSGTIRINITLNRLFSAFYGSDVDGNTSYTVKNFRVIYTSVEDDGVDEPVIMGRKLYYTSSIQSNDANIQARVPGVCSSVSCSFLKTSNQNQPTVNNYMTEKLPNLEIVEWQFNNSINEYVCYQFREEVEFLQNYIDSLRNTGKNSADLYKTSANNSFGLGLNFNDQIDMRNSNFSLQLRSDADNTNSYKIYMYFHSIVGF